MINKYKVLNSAALNRYCFNAADLKKLLENVDGNALIFLMDSDIEERFYNENDGLYSYSDLINKLKNLDYFENGGSIHIKHITSICVIEDNF